MNVRELLEALSLDAVEDKLDEVNWEDLTDIIKKGCELSDEELPAYLEGILSPDNMNNADLIKLWSDIEGPFEGNNEEIIKLMRQDLDNYISEKVIEWKEV